MKNKVIALIAALTMAGSMVACGNAAASESANTDTAQANDAAPADTDTAAADNAAQAADSDVAYIKDKGTLIVGITDFAPMDYKDDNGEWIGFDADMAKKVAESLGVKAEFVEIDWDNKILELENKSIDAVWNGMTLTNEVKNAMECTNAYLNNAQVVVVTASDADNYKTVDDVAGLSFAVESGSAGETAAADNNFEYTSLTSQADAVMEVAAGTSDACIIDLLMAGAMVGEGTSYENLTYTVELTTEEYGIGCRKGSDLAAFINDELKAYYADGSMQSTAKTYGVQEAIIAQ
ncbi:MAG: transporter substrate-binding domain-containing protein [Butyrivibrio sp.]|nr:transporter substrate-binding domain-containing protein [Butyrivibrio sp.]